MRISPTQLDGLFKLIHHVVELEAVDIEPALTIGSDRTKRVFVGRTTEEMAIHTQAEQVRRVEVSSIHGS
jgi:hypothetical protein